MEPRMKSHLSRNKGTHVYSFSRKNRKKMGHDAFLKKNGNLLAVTEEWELKNEWISLKSKTKPLLDE